MFENLFSPSPQLWSAVIGGLVALPILIHLINLMRHQNVEWAAMEFLLKSYRKNRNWVWLKQLLLLLSRIAALLLTLFMLAQIGCHEDRVGGLLGSATTHHYVLLDDSFSMSDRSTEGMAFDRALATLSQIASRAKNRQNQKFTLLRFSCNRDSGVTDENETSIKSASFADINGEVVDNQFGQRLENLKSRLQVSTLAVDVRNTLSAVTELIKRRDNENAIVYILSDFRAKDWQNPERVEQLLAEISQTGTAIEFIDCVKTERPNLAVTELRPAGNVRVAGTPLMMRLTVKNASPFAAEKIQIQIDSHTFADSDVDQQALEELQPTIENLPTVFVEKIEAGQAETREFPVFFASAGQHALKAMLKQDAIQVDNTYWNVTEFSSSARVLIIEDPSQSQGRFMALAMNPGGMTGLATDFRPKDFLRDATLDQLQEFDVIYLLDIDQLDDAAIKNLESYVLAGGGAGFLLGPDTNISFYTNQLYRNGEGVFPLPLEKSIEIPELMEARVPDIAAESHPLFPPGMKNPLLDLVQVKRIVQPPVDWPAKKSVDVTVAATIRGIPNWPLIVQRKFGQGNVMAFLSTAGPEWNNWCRNGTFPPMMLLLEDLLAKGNYTQSADFVGTPLQISAPLNELGPDVTFVIPSETTSAGKGFARVAVQKKMQVTEPSQQYHIQLGSTSDVNQCSDVCVPGVYDVWLRNSNGQLNAKRFALNVDSRESEMGRVNRQSLLAALQKSSPTMMFWDQFNPNPQTRSTSSITTLLLIALIALLVLEQFLAYSASYHARRNTEVTQRTDLGVSFRKTRASSTKTMLP